MPDATLARQYLALPVERYSVLDSNIISKSKMNPNKFIIRIPLDQAGQSSGMQYKRFNFQVACSVEVAPDEERGIITMQSGQLYFLPSPIMQAGKNNSSSNITSGGGKEIEYINIPEWLIWGGGQGSAVSAVDADVAEILQIDGSQLARSSVQAGFVLTLAYRPNDTDVDASGAFSGLFKSLFSRSSSSSSRGTNDTLAVSATIRAAVSVNLTSSGDATYALAFPPVKVLLEQVGSLTATSVLKIISPYLGISEITTSLLSL